MGDQVVSEGGDFAYRLERFQENLEPWMVIVAGLFAAIVLILTLRNRINWLMLFLLCALNFTGSIWTAVESVATLARWLLIFCIAINAARVTKWPGITWAAYAGFVTLGILCLPLGPCDSYNVQVAGLQAGVVMLAASVSQYALDATKSIRICTMFMVAAGFFAVPCLIVLPQYAGEWQTIRFSGPYTIAPYLATPAGLYLPFLAWGMSRRWNRFSKLWRVYCACLAIGLVVCLAVCGQRTGAMAGVVGCVPLLFRRGLIGIAALAVVLAVGGFLANYFLWSNPERAELIVDRYKTLDDSGRYVLWEQGWQQIMENPFLGKGVGYCHRCIETLDTEPTNVHNAYLGVWLDSGVFGFFLAVFSLLTTMWRMFRISMRDLAVQTVDGQLARLYLGVALTIAGNGMFTTGFTRPSSVMTIAFATLLPLAENLWRRSREENDERARMYAYWSSYWSRYSHIGAAQYRRQ